MRRKAEIHEVRDVRSALQKVGFDACLAERYGSDCVLCGGGSDEDAVKDVWHRWTRDGADGWNGADLADLLRWRAGIEKSAAIRYAEVFGPVWDFGHTTFAHLVEMIIEYALGTDSPTLDAQPSRSPAAAAAAQ